jgi:hypothetical protein
MNRCGRRRCFRRGFALAFFLMVSASGRPASGQAWVPPAGAGSVNFSIERIDNTGHLLTDGKLLPDGKSTDVALYVEAEYAFTDRFSASLGVPRVFAKYVGPGSTPFNFLPVDQCFCWHAGWQDLGLTARYSLVNGGLAVTPSVSAGVPSHDYNYRGEAVVGRRLTEIRVGVDVGRRLDAISRKLSVQGRYSYAFVERVLDIPNNRSNVVAEGSFVLSRNLSVRGLASWQRTHGGLRDGSLPPAAFSVPGDINTPERIAQHDRLLRDNNWHAGGGVAYSMTRVDLFASYMSFVGGTDTHAGRAVTVGISFPFEIGPARQIP